MKIIKKFLCFFLSVLLVLSAVALSGCSSSAVVVFDDDEKCSFDSFTVKNSLAYYECTLSLKNKTGKEVSFNIVGNFADDFNNGIIGEEDIIAKNENGGVEFTLGAKKSGIFKVEFCTDMRNEVVAKNTNEKLPDISIRLMDGRSFDISK